MKTCASSDQQQQQQEEEEEEEEEEEAVVRNGLLSQTCCSALCLSTTASDRWREAQSRYGVLGERLLFPKLGLGSLGRCTDAETGRIGC